MPIQGTTIEFVPIFEGSLSLKEQLVSMIVDKILCKTEGKPLPKSPLIGYNIPKVPRDSEAPGLCEGVS